MTAPGPLWIGLDLVEIPRFARAVARHGERLLNRLFTPRERALAAEHIERLAVRFAAKEAAAKALGTGIGPVAWIDLEVLTSPNGAPELHLHGAAAVRAHALGWQGWSLSLSHSRSVAAAVVVAWGVAPHQGLLADATQG